MVNILKIMFLIHSGVHDILCEKYDLLQRMLVYVAMVMRMPVAI